LTQDEAQALVDAADRSDEDRERDARRHPAEFLVFTGVHRGAHVAEIGAGSGYTTELLVRAVGPEGVVYGHNEPAVIEKFLSESWPARLARPGNEKVARTSTSS
jgi:predicted methyltransferase